MIESPKNSHEELFSGDRWTFRLDLDPSILDTAQEKMAERLAREGWDQKAVSEVSSKYRILLKNTMKYSSIADVSLHITPTTIDIKLKEQYGKTGSSESSLIYPRPENIAIEDAPKERGQ
jgi:hypothetical protein